MKHRALVVGALQVGHALAAALTVLLLVRMLSREDYGHYVYYSSLATLLPLFVGLGDARGVKKKFPGSDNIFFRHGYLTDEAYQMAICDSRFVFLPHNRFFEGKVSGILSDCIANKVPIISDAIEPVIEFFHTYGAMGYLCDYASQHWAQQIVGGLSEYDYEKLREAMRVCFASHSPTVIMNELLAADNCGMGRIQQPA